MWLLRSGTTKSGSHYLRVWFALNQKRNVFPVVQPADVLR